MIDTESYSYRKLGGRGGSLQYLRDHPFCLQTLLGLSLHIIFASLVQCSLGTRGIGRRVYARWAKTMQCQLTNPGHFLIKIQIQIQRWCHIVSSYVAHTEIRIEKAVLPISQFHDFWATGLTSSRCIITRPATFAA